MKTLNTAVVVMFTVHYALLCGIAWAETSPASQKSLEERVRELEERVVDLQQRIIALESGGRGEAALTSEAILRWAAEQGYVDIVQSLLNKGSDMNAADAQGRTALMLATGSGHGIVVQVLLENGAELHVKDQQGNTAVMLARENKYPFILQALLKYGGASSDPIATSHPLPEVRSEDSEPDIHQEELAEEGQRTGEADVEAENIDAVHEEGYTALMRAVSEGELEKVEWLLQQGADVNAQSDGGYTALMLAVAGNYGDIAQRLIEQGADLHTQTEKGYTALMLAAAEGYLELVRGLVERGADVTIKAASGWTALDLARSSEDSTMIDVLEKAQYRIGPGKYAVTVDGLLNTTSLPDVTPMWNQKARDICGGRDYHVLSKAYHNAGMASQSMTGVIECQ